MISKIKITLFQHSDVLLCLIILAHVAVAYVMSLYAGGTQWLKINGPLLSYAYLAAFFSAICLVYALIKGTIKPDYFPFSMISSTCALYAG